MKPSRGQPVIWFGIAAGGSPSGSRRGGTAGRRGTGARPGTLRRISGGTSAASPATSPAAAPPPASGSPCKTESVRSERKGGARCGVGAVIGSRAVPEPWAEGVGTGVTADVTNHR